MVQDQRGAGGSEDGNMAAAQLEKGQEKKDFKGLTGWRRQEDLVRN